MKLKDLMKIKGTYIFCPRCGSPYVTHTRPCVDTYGNIRTEVYHVECQSCGLRGNLEENWFWKDGDDDDVS